MQFQKQKNDLGLFLVQTIQHYISIPSPYTNHNAKEAEVEQFYDDLQDLLELTPNKRCPFHQRGL